jgi:hypothetical protein
MEDEHTRSAVSDGTRTAGMSRPCLQHLQVIITRESI